MQHLWNITNQLSRLINLASSTSSHDHVAPELRSISFGCVRVLFNRLARSDLGVTAQPQNGTCKQTVSAPQTARASLRSESRCSCASRQEAEALLSDFEVPTQFACTCEPPRVTRSRERQAGKDLGSKPRSNREQRAAATAMSGQRVAGSRELGAGNREHAGSWEQGASVRGIRKLL